MEITILSITGPGRVRAFRPAELCAHERIRIARAQFRRTASVMDCLYEVFRRGRTRVWVARDVSFSRRALRRSSPERSGQIRRRDFFDDNYTPSIRFRYYQRRVRGPKWTDARNGNRERRLFIFLKRVLSICFSFFRNVYRVR